MILLKKLRFRFASAFVFLYNMYYYLIKKAWRPGRRFFLHGHPGTHGKTNREKATKRPKTAKRRKRQKEQTAPGNDLIFWSSQDVPGPAGDQEHPKIHGGARTVTQVPSCSRPHDLSSKARAFTRGGRRFWGLL